MTRALLITNPAAARTDARALTAVRETLRRAGWTVEVAATAKPGDARRLALRGRDEGFDTMLSYGGDGTAMQIAAAVAGTGIPLGLIPGGTGNVLAGNLRLPRRPLAAVQSILRGTAVQIDLGAVDRPDGTHYFAVCCGAGFDAALMRRTDAAAKRRWRRAAYVRAALLSLRSVKSARVRITIDGVDTVRDAAMVLVCNCADLMPPFLRLHRDIRPEDGILDVVAMRADGMWQSVAAFFELMQRRPSARRDQVWYGRGTSVAITVEEGEPFPAQLDGEDVGTSPLVARVLPGALRVFVDPNTAPVSPGGGGG
jgi:YegS/Rv2252/BmrU family lipid kinase